MKFVDKVRLFAAAGSGGDGCLSFRREKYVEMGGPDGGDGGKGGDIWLEASERLTTLLDVACHPHVKGHPGSHGKGSQKTGESGEDLTVLVPVGTVVYKDAVPVADLRAAGQRFLAAHGGRGGRGNLSFKSRLNTAPRLCEKGEPGEITTLDLELKLIADVGLVGFPNAGKSSLLARLSRARPKIADYPFTTLSPNLGIAAHKGVSFAMADIPGLIEGAHAGKGLGMDFLRHVERTRVLVHLIDPAGFGGKDAAEGIKAIEAELKAFSRRLASKPRVIVFNKIDLPDSAPVVKKLSAKLKASKPLSISAATGVGLSALLDRLILELSRAEPPEPAAREGEKLVEVDPGFSIEPQGAGAYRLRGRFVERAAAMLESTLPEAVARFQRSLRRIGVDRALRRAGVQEGDIIRCGSLQFEWSDAPRKTLPRIKGIKRTRVAVGKR